MVPTGFTAFECSMPGAEQIPETRGTDRCRKRRCRRSSGRRLSGFAAFAGSILVAVMPARAQTLTQALAETYNTNPQLLAQRALLRATDEGVPQALSGWRPTVNFTGQLGGARSSFATGTPPIIPRTTVFSTF